jgi:hypothetical protein
MALLISKSDIEWVLEVKTVEAEFRYTIAAMPPAGCLSMSGAVGRSAALLSMGAVKDRPAR